MKTDTSALVQQICQRYHAIILDSTDRQLRVAVNNVPIQALSQALRFVTDQPLELVQCSSAQLAHYASDRETVAEEEAATTTASQSLAQLLHIARQRRSSDIHIEPQADTLRIRLRIDGVLHAHTSLALNQHAALLARLKILAQLDIAEKRLPQDGQFTQKIQDRLYAFRLSTLPTQYGEKAVIRLLESHAQHTTLDSLGMSLRALHLYKTALNQPQGLILVTGPTGSGKTFTLYSGLNALNTSTRNVCSVEDPVEIPVEGVNQTQIHTVSGLNFQRVLRALLRQDPDVIMIGEIRDPETADIAVKAAQTGHLVLSTLHTNSTSETLIRLGQMGIPGYLLATSLKLIIAQRLLRRLCSHCRRPGETMTHFPSALWPGTLKTWIAIGCSHCFSGFYGRLALFELLPVGNRLQNAIAQSRPPEKLTALAKEQGMNSLFSEGLNCVNQGETTLDELYRVIGIPNEDT
ncbi:type II secretion system protein GspE [Enterobacteriaceae bacterium LUAb1]